MKLNLENFWNRYWKRIVLILGIAFMVWLNIYKKTFGMDLIILTFLITSVFFDNPWKFLKDWLPPISLFYLYEALRAQAYNFSQHFGLKIWIKEIIDIERALFFFLDDVPSVKLQRWLKPDYGVEHWYDYVLFFVYSSFFWFWIGVGFILWINKRELFKRYIWGLVLFSLFGVIIFALAPSAPPWYASDNGYLPYLSRTLWQNNYLPGDGVSFVSTYGVNDVAAIPSFHTAWPFYGALFLIYAYGKKMLPIILLPISIAFATWYGAEHYVIDSIIGAGLATIAFIIAVNWEKIVRKVKSKK